MHFRSRIAFIEIDYIWLFFVCFCLSNYFIFYSAITINSNKIFKIKKAFFILFYCFNLIFFIALIGEKNLRNVFLFLELSQRNEKKIKRLIA